MESQIKEIHKTLGQRDIVLFTVSAILLLETLTAAASIGPAAIFWWLFLGLVFFVPFALICAEMGCTYPEEGGIYAWIRDGFGGRWGARASWGYWVNTAVWLPAIYIMFAGVFAQLLAPDLSLSWQIGLGIVLTWITVGLNTVTMDVGKWIPNLGAMVKIVIFLLIIGAAFAHTSSEGFANPITWDTIQPDWNSSAAFIPAIIYGMLGFELVSASSSEMKDPARDVPKGILISGLIIITLYTCATIAVLAAVPADEIDLVEGLVETLTRFFGSASYGTSIVTILGIGALYTFFTNGVTWALGCNRAAAEAASEGELPSPFAIKSAVGSPIGAAVMMGVASTVVLVMYGVMATNAQDLFWSLFAFSAVIFLLPYIGLILAFVRTRVHDADRLRPFRIPGGLQIARVCASLCIITLAASIVLFMYTPGEGVQYPVLLGVVVTVAIGELVIRYSEKQRTV